jgi:hypothetical protein
MLLPGLIPGARNIYFFNSPVFVKVTINSMILFKSGKEATILFI